MTLDRTLSFDERKALQEELALLRELTRRRVNDPLLGFQPHRRQKEFIDSVLGLQRYENWFLAANRAGKSDAGAYTGAFLARFGRADAHYVKGKGSNVEVKDRSTSGWVVSLDFPSSRDIIQPKYFDNGFLPPGSTHAPFIPAHEIAEWRVSDQVLKLRNGSIIGFKSADSGRTKFQGAEKDWIHFDEEPPEGIYEESVIRVGQRRLSVFGTCTLLPPEGQVGGVTWVYNKKVKPWKMGMAPDIGIFSASIYDNPHIDPNEILRLEALYPEGSIQRRIRLNGELLASMAGSRVYAAFNPLMHVQEQPEINIRRPLAWIWDFNVEPMVSLIGQRDGNVFRVFQELILDEGNIMEMCDLFRYQHPHHMAEVWVYGDASGQSRSAHSNKTSYQLILNAMQSYSAPVRLKVPEKNPPVQWRINAVNRICRSETGEVMLSISPSCTELIDDLEQVISDGKGGIKKISNRKDPYFKRTHTSDALGYWVHMEEPVPAGSEVERNSRAHIRVKRPGYMPSPG